MGWGNEFNLQPKGETNYMTDFDILQLALTLHKWSAYAIVGALWAFGGLTIHHIVKRHLEWRKDNKCSN